MRNSSAYIHIPFCVKKCPYCDFVSYGQMTDHLDDYIDAVCREIDMVYASCPEDALSTVYFGGGTPSLMKPAQVSILMEKLRSTFGIQPDAEVTLEANPGTVTGVTLHGYREIGINRLSVGIQSFSQPLLTAIGRIHTAEQAENTVVLARESGFSNISCDLMTGLPGQSVKDAMNSLAILTKNKIPHISFYALILEEGTDFYQHYNDHPDFLPSQEEERKMHHSMRNELLSRGYLHYEISNCALPGYESRHNTVYWKGLPYFGFGCGAHSYVDGKRIGNTADLDGYIREMKRSAADLSIVKKEIEIISRDESYKEFMLLGFRLTRGVSSMEFEERFHISMETLFGETIDSLCNKGLIIQMNHRYFLSEKGLDYANEVFRAFV